MTKKKPRPFKRPPFVPTAEQAKSVQTMASFGITQDNIAKCVVSPITGKAITAKTLRRAFREELTTGKTRMVSNVATSLYNKAISRGSQAVTACIFILKTQAGAVGAPWRDKFEIKHTGLTDSFAERLAKAIATKTHARISPKT